MTEAQTKQSPKVVLSLMLGIPLAVIALSSLLFYLANSGKVDLGTVNRGTLIEPPVQLSDIQPRALDGSDILFNLPDSSWTFLVVGGGECRGACERMLYLSRQSHTALGKKMPRVSRLYLSLDGFVGPQLAELINAEHDDLVIGSVEAEALRSLLATSDIESLADNRFYVIDPKGWLMMYYSADSLDQDSLNALGKDVLKDMKRLLR